MSELLALSVGIGLAVGLLFSELFGVATGGLIVPGYFALFIDRPLDIASTLAVAFATWAIVRAIASQLIVFGRRRTALMIMVGYLLGMITGRWTGVASGELAVIGFVIPGLVALWMDRQGVIQTLCSLTIVSVMVRLLLIVLLGTEALS